MSSDLLAIEHWWIVAPFFWALWFGVIALVLFLVLRGRRMCGPARTSARDILAERFARGELSSDEYHERLKALR